MRKIWIFFLALNIHSGLLLSQDVTFNSIPGTEIDFPYAVAIADLNGDDVNDIISGTAFGEVSILLGAGNREFGSETTFSVGGSPFSIEIDFFNDDLIPDIVVGNLSGSNVSVLLGDGTGSFGTATNFTVGTQPRDLTIGDLNEDGNRDIVSANAGSNNVTLLLGDGNGAFTNGGDFTVGTSPYGVIVGDFNEDDDQDLAVANANSNNITLLFGDGMGGFGTTATISSLVSPRRLEKAFFNDDLHEDIVVVNAIGDDVTVLLGDGMGGFSATDLPANDDPRMVLVGDLNNDNDTDFITFGNTGFISWYLGNGDGTFGTLSDFKFGGIIRAAIGDLDDDGNQDIIAASTSAVIFYGDGAGDFEKPTTITTPTNSSPLSVTTADFDDSGTLDIAVVNASLNQLGVYFGDGAGNFGSEALYSVGASSDHVITADFNNDTDPDIAVVSGTTTSNPSSNIVTILINDGSGSFTSSTLATDIGAIKATSGLFNDDANIDLAVSNINSDNVNIFLGDGSGGFTSAPDLTQSIPIGGVTGLFDDDSNLDLAVLNGSSLGQVGIFLGDGAGNFTGGTEYLLTASNPYEVVTADFNGDDNLDLATANGSSANGGVAVLLGDGMGGFGTPTKYSFTGAPQSIAIGDFNQDGEFDLVTANTGNVTVSVLLGDGTGNFADPINFFVGSAPRHVAVGDFNGDNKDDIAIAVQTAGGVIILTNETDFDADDDGIPDSLDVCPGFDDNIDGDEDDIPLGCDCDDTDPETGEAPTWYADTDGDGFGDPDVTMEACDQPMDFVANSDDCDDTDGDINPDTIWYADTDGDGFGDAGTTLTSCGQPEDYVANDLDCDDTDEDIDPDTEWYPDVDNDGFGDETADPLIQCDQPAGHVMDNTDCDDLNANINPGTSWFVDADHDGFGDMTADPIIQCEDPTDAMQFVLNNDDPDDATPDRDNDGLSDADELTLGTNPDDPDTDGDGLTDGDEVNSLSTDPLKPDSDDDDLDDGVEIDLGLDPNDEDTDGDDLKDGAEINQFGTEPDDDDTDNDNLKDGDEINIFGTDPTLADTDEDGLDDDVEINETGTQPDNADTDDDGLTDGQEVNVTGTDPDDADTDDDNLTDGEEVNSLGTDPDDADTDDDELTDGAEINDFGTEPDNPDTDGDGLTDGEEINVTGTDPNIADTDNDDINDGDEVNSTDTDPEDPDSDDDDLLDGEEITLGTDPNLADTDGDGCTDAVEVAQSTDPLVEDSDPDDDGILTCDGDCDDTDPEIGIGPTYYADTDADGFGDPNNSMISCTPLEGFVANNTDCDDTDANVYPGAPALPDGKNNDCSADNSIDRVAQTITFDELSDIVFSDAVISLAATSSSGLDISYSVTGPATLNGTTLTLTGAGPVTIIASQGGNDSQYLEAESVTRTFCVNPVQPSIVISGNVLTASSSSGNTWFKDGAPISGETGSTLTITDDGSYTVQTSVGGCSSSLSEAVTASVTTGILDDLQQNLTVYPNPVESELHIDLGASELSVIEVDLIDFLGKRYRHDVLSPSVTSDHITIDVSFLTSGVYLYNLVTPDGVLTGKIIKN